jgi:hypothetical protein
MSVASVTNPITTVRVEKMFDDLTELHEYRSMRIMNLVIEYFWQKEEYGERYDYDYA